MIEHPDQAPAQTREQLEEAIRRETTTLRWMETAPFGCWAKQEVSDQRWVVARLEQLLAARR